MDNTTYTCCFCGGKFNDWGNNPWPANNDADAKCCDTCNMEIVLPARMHAIFSQKKEGNKV